MKWGVLGASRIASQHMIKSILDGGDSVCGVVTKNDRAWEENGFEVLGVNRKRDLDELFSENPDVIYISSNNSEHVSQAIYCLRNQCHVLCEKPLGLSTESLASLRSELRGSNRTFGVNHHLRFSRLHQRLKLLIEEKIYGELLRVKVNHLVSLPDSLRTWRVNDSESGGVALDIFCHDVDLIRFLTGSELLSIELDGATCNHLGVDLACSSRVLMKNGLKVQFKESFIHHEPDYEINLEFQDVNVVAKGSLSQKGEGNVTVYDKCQKWIDSIEVPPTRLYDEIVRSFRNSVKKGEQHSVDFEAGYQATYWALLLRDLIRRSAWK